MRCTGESLTHDLIWLMKSSMYTGWPLQATFFRMTPSIFPHGELAVVPRTASTRRYGGHGRRAMASQCCSIRQHHVIPKCEGYDTTPRPTH